jgi:hypothetical protein
VYVWKRGRGRDVSGDTIGRLIDWEHNPGTCLREMHACEMQACEMQACEMQAGEIQASGKQNRLGNLEPSHEVVKKSMAASSDDAI